MGYGGRVDSGYSIRRDSERRFQHARGTKPSRRVRKDLRAAFAANSNYSDHCLRVGVRSHLVLRRIQSKITPALKTRISPIYTNALTVSVLAQLRGHSCNSWSLPPQFVQSASIK